MVEAGPVGRENGTFRSSRRDLKESGSSAGSVQALKEVDILPQTEVASITQFRLETQHVHQFVVP